MIGANEILPKSYVLRICICRLYNLYVLLHVAWSDMETGRSIMLCMYVYVCIKPSRRASLLLKSVHSIPYPSISIEEEPDSAFTPTPSSHGTKTHAPHPSPKHPHPPPLYMGVGVGGLGAGAWDSVGMYAERKKALSLDSLTHWRRRTYIYYTESQVVEREVIISDCGRVPPPYHTMELKRGRLGHFRNLN